MSYIIYSFSKIKTSKYKNIINKKMQHQSNQNKLKQSQSIYDIISKDEKTNYKKQEKSNFSSFLFPNHQSQSRIFQRETKFKERIFDIENEKNIDNVLSSSNLIHKTYSFIHSNNNNQSIDNQNRKTPNKQMMNNDSNLNENKESHQKQFSSPFMIRLNPNNEFKGRTNNKFISKRLFYNEASSLIDNNELDLNENEKKTENLYKNTHISLSKITNSSTKLEPSSVKSLFGNNENENEQSYFGSLTNMKQNIYKENIFNKEVPSSFTSYKKSYDRLTPSNKGISLQLKFDMSKMDNVMKDDKEKNNDNDEIEEDFQSKESKRVLESILKESFINQSQSQVNSDEGNEKNKQHFEFSTSILDFWGEDDKNKCQNNHSQNECNYNNVFSQYSKSDEYNTRQLNESKNEDYGNSYKYMSNNNLSLMYNNDYPKSIINNTPLCLKLVSEKGDQMKTKIKRNIPSKAFKVLDAVGIIDDYYLNLMDWSVDDIISTGIRESVFFISNKGSKISKLVSYENGNYIGSVSFSPNGSELAVGKYDGILDIYDVNSGRVVSSFPNHISRINAISWNNSKINPNLIATGSKDSKVIIRDVRLKPNESSIYELQEHTHEVCGLKFSHDGNYLAAGGNDNLLMVWDIRKIVPNKRALQFNNDFDYYSSNNYIIKSFDHKAAVKAIAWNPLQRHCLASGGGSHDQTIKFWNTANGVLVNSVHTGTQVCNLVFSMTTDELISSHGFSQNQIHVWNTQSVKHISCIATLTGHLNRVLYLALSPEGDNIVTAAGDETIRFWKVFPKYEETGCIINEINETVFIR